MMKKHLLLTFFIIALPLGIANAKPGFFTKADFAEYNIDKIDGSQDGYSDYPGAAMKIKAELPVNNDGEIVVTYSQTVEGATMQQVAAKVRDWLSKACEEDDSCKILSDKSTGELKALFSMKDLSEFDSNWQGNSQVAIPIYLTFNCKDGEFDLSMTIPSYVVKNYKEYLKSQNSTYGLSTSVMKVGNKIGRLFNHNDESKDKIPRDQENVWSPGECFPYVEEFQATDDMKKSEIKRGEKLFDVDKPVAARACVMTYIYTQVIKTKIKDI